MVGLKGLLVRLHVCSYAMIEAKRAMGRPKDLQTVLELAVIRAKRGRDEFDPLG